MPSKSDECCNVEPAVDLFRFHNELFLIIVDKMMRNKCIT